MKVYAVRSPELFTRVANTAARDARLSYKARGLLLYLLSHQDGFNLSVAALRAASTDGKDAIATGLAELEGAGYLVRVRVRASGGQLGAVAYVVADDPALIDAEAVAAEIGGRVVAADAVARYTKRLAGNPPNHATNGAEFAGNPPKPENPPKAEAPAKSGKPVAGNPPKDPTIGAEFAGNPPKAGRPPQPGYPAAGNPAAKEDEGKEEDDNTARVVVGDKSSKAPNSPAEGFGAQAGVKTKAEAPASPTVAAGGLGADASLPRPNGRAALAVDERWAVAAFVAAWNEAIGARAPWSPTNTDFAHHALTYWTQAEILSVLASMGRAKRDISSPLRYLASGLEKKAREVRQPTARPGTKRAAQLSAAPPKTPAPTAPDEALDLSALPPEVRARVEAKMKEFE